MSILAKLQLENYSFREFSISYDIESVGFNDKKGSEYSCSELLPNVEFNIYFSKDEERKFMSELILILEKKENEPPPPFYFKISLWGLFSLDSNNKNDENKNLILLNTTAILYGIARSYLSQIMIHGPFTDYILPCLNFVEIANKKIKNRQEEMVTNS